MKFVDPGLRLSLERFLFLFYSVAAATGSYSYPCIWPMARAPFDAITPSAQWARVLKSVGTGNGFSRAAAGPFAHV